MDSLIHQRYQVVRSLSSGTFGTTFLAKDTALPNAPHCILKKFQPQTEDVNLNQSIQALFEREVEVLQQIGQHDQIPQILDHFEQDQAIYLVREYIAGETLRETQKQQPLWTQPQAISFLLEMLPILVFIHQNGIIHRDIKPENIVWRSPDRKLCLIDFGAVKSNTQLQSTNTSPTIIHSYGYSPPEQLAGFPEPNSDLYALGMTCLEMLLGEKPAAFIQVEKDNKRVIRGLQQSGICETLQAILERMVLPNCQQRYLTADAVIQDLCLLKTDSLPIPNRDYTPTQILPPKTLTQPASTQQGYTPTHWGTGLAATINEASIRPPIDKKRRSQQTKPQLPAKVDPVIFSAELNQYLNKHSSKLSLQKLKKPFPKLSIKQSISLLLVFPIIGLLAILSGYWQTNTHTLDSSAELTNTHSSSDSSSSTFHVKVQLPTETSSIQFLGFAATDQTLVSALTSGSIKLHNLQNSTTHSLTQTSSSILAIARSPTQDFLALATANRQIEIWNLKTKQRSHQFPTNQLMWAIAITNNGSQTATPFPLTPFSLATGGLNTLNRWYGTLTQAEHQTLEFSPQHTEPIQAIALNADGSILAGGDAQGSVKIIHLATRQSRLFDAHTQAVNAAVVDASSTVLITGSDDDTIRLWNLYALQECPRPLIRAELGGVTAIAPHPDQAVIAAGGNNGTVKLWNWKTGQLLGTLPLSHAKITALAFSLDGKNLAVGDRDGKITIFEIVLN